MLKKIAVSSLCLMLLAGCDSPEKTDVTDAGQKAEQNASKTAVYLPGGGGIDFRRKALKDLVSEVGDNQYKVFVYEFDESFHTVDKAVNSILAKDGYLRGLQTSADDHMVVSYGMKASSPVVFRYKNENKDGVGQKTILHMSWSLKGLVE